MATPVTEPPSRATTICNTLWGSCLTFTPFPPSSTAAGERKCEHAKLVSFDQLFPEGKNLVETCREVELDREPLELCSLLLASGSYQTLARLLKNGVLTVSEPLSHKEPATLLHLACALGVAPAISDIRDTLNGASNSSFVWGLKDREERTPSDVCFNQELAKKLLPHKPLFGKKKINSTAPRSLTDREKAAIFQLAKEPENFYTLIVALRSFQVKVDSERDEIGDLLIHTAIRRGLPALPLLLALVNHFKADINARNGNGLTPLALACTLEHTRIAEVLVCVGGADVEFRESTSGRTPLHSAVLAGHPDVAQMLLRRGADAAAEDGQSCDSEFLAKKAGHHECRQILSQHSRERFSFFASQTMTGSLDVARVTTADVCRVTEDGETLLMIAAKHGHAHLLSQLVEIKKCPLDYRQMKIPDLLDVSMRLSASLRGLPESGDHPFTSALHCATQAGHLECVQILLRAHAHPSLPDCDGWLPLHYAIDSDIVRAILNHPSPLSLSGLFPAMTLARERGNRDIIELLEEAISRRQREIVTPALFDTAVTGKSDHLFTILENGDDVNPLKETYDWPLLLAAGFGYLDIVEHLYKFGGHVTRSHPKTGVTPLHVAARGGRENVVSYLLQFAVARTTAATVGREGEGEGGRDINCRNRAGATPLELAAAQGHNTIIRLLLNSGASCTLPDSNGQLLSCPGFPGLQFSLETHRRERVMAICQALGGGAELEEFRSVWQGPWDFNLRTESEDTILMVAAGYAPVAVVRFLLSEASRAPPTILVEGGIPVSSPRKQAVGVSEDSEHTQSDTHFTPKPGRRGYLDSWERERPGSVVSHMMPGKKGHKRSRSGVDRRHNRGRRRRGRGRSPQRVRNRRAAASGASNVSSGDDSDGEGEGRDDGSLREEEGTSNTGICLTIIRATNPHDGQTALHRAVHSDRLDNVALLLKSDPECQLAGDGRGDTPLHMACRVTQRKVQRRIVESLLGCDKRTANVRNRNGQLPEDDCPHSKTRKLVMKKRAEDDLVLPDTPCTDPKKAIRPISMDGSNCTTDDGASLDINKLSEMFKELREEKIREISSTSEHDTST